MKLNSIKYAKIIQSFVLILLGIFSMIWPSLAYEVLSWVVGGFLIIEGIINIVEYWRFSKGDDERQLVLIFGVGLIILGLFFLFIPSLIIKALMGLIIALGLALIGTYLIVRALIEKGIVDSWLFRLLIGIVTIIGSLMVFANLNATASALAFSIGTISVYIGLNRIFSVLLVKKKSDINNDQVDIDFTKK